eukprot:UN04672
MSRYPVPPTSVFYGLQNIPDLDRIFTEDQIRQFRETFDSITRGRQARLIRVEELGDVMRAMGFSPDEVELQDMLEEMKLPRRNACLDFEHFVRILARKFSDVQIRNVFRVFDQDGDGVINIQELKNVLLRLGERLSEQELMEMMQEADVDGDNLLNFDDFTKIMRAP